MGQIVHVEVACSWSKIPQWSYSIIATTRRVTEESSSGAPLRVQGTSACEALNHGIHVNVKRDSRVVSSIGGSAWDWLPSMWQIIRADRVSPTSSQAENISRSC